MTRVIMNGCNGKMGQCITNICKNDADIQIVAGIDVYQEIENDYPVFASIQECNVEADVIIDFSTASAIDELLDYCEEKEIFEPLKKVLSNTQKWFNYLRIRPLKRRNL